MSELEIYTDDLYDQIEVNRSDIVDLQVYSRRENIEIYGIPDSVNNKNLEKTVVQILNSIGVKISSYKITACHRLKKEKNSRYSNVIVRFMNRKDAYKAIRNSYKL